MDTLVHIEESFEKTPDGVFMKRNGRGQSSSGSYSNKKLCFVATDKMILAELLLELSEREDCYGVKYSVQPRAGMFLGRCFMTEDQVVGELWVKYKPHPKLMCTVQDDDFTSEFRNDR